MELMKSCHKSVAIHSSHFRWKTRNVQSAKVEVYISLQVAHIKTDVHEIELAKLSNAFNFSIKKNLEININHRSKKNIFRKSWVSLPLHFGPADINILATIRYSAYIKSSNSQ